MIRNREDLADFHVEWPWADGDLEPGMTAVLRVRNEARNLPWVLPPLLWAVDRVVLVDNGSTDGTAEVAGEVAERAGAGRRVSIVEYPFDVSRCGAEHLQTPSDSVRSLTHFNNWALAQVRTRYSMKWDGDMVLTPDGVAMVADVSWQLGGEEAIVVFQHQPLYVESPQVAYFDVKFRNAEPWIYPMGPRYTFVKGFDWEIRAYPPGVRRLVMPRGLCFELKWLDKDEFSHWTPPRDTGPLRSRRKARELEVFTALLQGRFDKLDGVHRVEAPPGVHVVDHVARRGLPAQLWPTDNADAAVGPNA